MPGRRAPETSDAGAEIIRMLAVLLRAGAPPAAAWRHLADSGDGDVAAVASAVADAADGQGGIVETLRAGGGVWRELAAAWSIATTVGAPLGEVLRSMADALQDAQATADEVRIALAEPAGTARLMLWLPLVGMLLGLALGFDTVGVAFSHPLGAGCVLLGVALILAGRAWTRMLVRRAQPAPGIAGLHAELVAVALSGGSSIERAQRLVADEEDPSAADRARIERVLRLSAAAGVPAVELLRAAAAEERRAARVQGRVRAARLSSRLLLPLGVCVLPAFLLLGVAPLVLSVLTSTPLPIGGLP